MIEAKLKTKERADLYTFNMYIRYPKSFTINS